MKFIQLFLPFGQFKESFLYEEVIIEKKEQSAHTRERFFWFWQKVNNNSRRRMNESFRAMMGSFDRLCNFEWKVCG